MHIVPGPKEDAAEHGETSCQKNARICPGHAVDAADAGDGDQAKEQPHLKQQRLPCGRQRAVQVKVVRADKAAGAPQAQRRFLAGRAFFARGIGWQGRQKRCEIRKKQHPHAKPKRHQLHQPAFAERELHNEHAGDHQNTKHAERQKALVFAPGAAKKEQQHGQRVARHKRMVATRCTHCSHPQSLINTTTGAIKSAV